MQQICYCWFFPQWLVKVNKRLVSCPAQFVLSHSSGTLSSLEFHFSKCLHIQETCVGLLTTTSWHVFCAALLFWNPHSEWKPFTGVVVKFKVRRNFLTKNSNFPTVGAQWGEHKDHVDIFHAFLHLLLPEVWDLEHGIPRQSRHQALVDHYSKTPTFLEHIFHVCWLFVGVYFISSQFLLVSVGSTKFGGTSTSTKGTPYEADGAEGQMEVSTHSPDAENPGGFECQ